LPPLLWDAKHEAGTVERMKAMAVPVAHRPGRWRRSWRANLGALAFQLSADDLNGISAAAEAIEIEGASNPDALERRTGL